MEGKNKTSNYFKVILSFKTQEPIELILKAKNKEEAKKLFCQKWGLEVREVEEKLRIKRMKIE